MEPTEPVLRRAGPEDGARVRKLLQACLPDNPKSDSDIMRWQYWENPFGDANCWVYMEGERVLCHQARVPIPVCIGGRRALGVLTVDVATDEEYRKHGLFSSLLQAANEDACNQKLEVGISFRGQGSMLPRWTRQRLSPLTHFVLPLEASWLAERLRVPGFVARSLIRRSREHGGVETRTTSAPDVNALWRVIEPTIKWGVLRDEAWWRWRFDGHPHKPYRHFVLRQKGRLTAVAVIRLTQRGEHLFADVLELMADSSSSARSVVRGIAAETPEVVALSFLTQKRSDGAQLAKAAGFRSAPRRMESNPLVLNLRDMCEAGLDLRPESWRITWADMDHL